MSQASIIGDTTHVAQHDTVTYHTAWSGGQLTNGDLTIEASLDGETWETLDFGATMSLDGASDADRAIINEVGFSYVRPVYTRTNALATGTLNVSVFASNKGA